MVFKQLASFAGADAPLRAGKPFNSAVGSNRLASGHGRTLVAWEHFLWQWRRVVEKRATGVVAKILSVGATSPSISAVRSNGGHAWYVESKLGSEGRSGRGRIEWQLGRRTVRGLPDPRSQIGSFSRSFQKALTSGNLFSSISRRSGNDLDLVSPTARAGIPQLDEERRIPRSIRSKAIGFRKICCTGG